MIGQYLSQTNESATVPVLQNFLELNKAQTDFNRTVFLDPLGRWSIIREAEPDWSR